jgi:uncharacterized RDD family membrane protein YckC
MSAEVSRPSPNYQDRPREIVVDFSAEDVRSPFLLRCGALLIDYIFVLIAPVASLLLSRFMGNDGARLLSSELSNAGWLIGALVAVTNLVVLPMFSGRSLGKMISGLTIVRTDGGAPSTGAMLLRQTAGYLLGIATLGLGFLLSVTNRRGRALHDYLAGTVVIYADRRTR